MVDRCRRPAHLAMPAHQHYETLFHPQGLLIELVITSTWGDPFYVGLDGLQIIGSDGKPMALQPEQVCTRLGLCTPAHTYVCTPVAQKCNDCALAE